jgi:hypothetical protein
MNKQVLRFLAPDSVESELLKRGLSASAVELGSYPPRMQKVILAPQWLMEVIVIYAD